MLTELMASSCFSVSVQNPNDLDQKFVNIVKKLLNPQVVEHPTLQLLSCWSMKQLKISFFY